MRLYMPTKVFFGSGCVLENGAELKALGSRAMIVTGKHSSRINGSLAAVEQALQANGQTYVIFDEIEENPSVETVAVAAGIAVKEQVDFLRSIECDIVQGYYYSKPMPMEEYEKYLLQFDLKSNS